MIDERASTNPKALSAIKEAVSTLVLRLPLVGLTLLGRALLVTESAGVPMYATDGRSVWYNPDYAAQQTHADVVFDLLHEWLHVFGNDSARRGSRVPHTWNHATDISVISEATALLGQSASKDSIEVPTWAKRGDAKEIIYDRLLEKKLVLPPNRCCVLKPARKGDDPGFLSVFQQDVAQAVVVAERMAGGRGKSLSDVYGARVTARLARLQADHTPWARLIRGRLQGLIGHGTLSWRPPSLRYWPHSVTPRMRTMQEDHLVIAVDVSASMNDDMMSSAMSAVAGAARRAKRVTVVVFDSKIREVFKTRDPKTVMKNVKFLQGEHSSTSAMGVFELATKERATTIVVITDGFVMHPPKEEIPTLWLLVPNAATSMPWGTSYVMEPSW